MCKDNQVNELLVRIQELEEQLSTSSSGCPCKYTEPCSQYCSCVNNISSYGCTRCCNYGNQEQREGMAKKLASLRPSIPTLVVGDEVEVIKGITRGDRAIVTFVDNNALDYRVMVKFEDFELPQAYFASFLRKVD